MDFQAFKHRGTSPRQQSASRKPIASRHVTAFQTVSLKLHSIECLKTTKEVDADEIAIVGLATSVVQSKGQAYSKTKPGKELSLGKFKKGDVRRFDQAKVIGTFDFGGGDAAWPRSYPLTLLLIEKDQGLIGQIAARFADAIDEKVATSLKTVATTTVEALAAAAGVGGATGSVVPVIGTAVGAAVGAGVMAASAVIQKSRQDDVLPPEHYALNLSGEPAKKGEIGGTRRVHKISGFKGVYQLVTFWTVE